MNPLRADLHALGAFAALRLFNGINRIEMRAAAIAHLRLPLLLAANRS